MQQNDIEQFFFKSLFFSNKCSNKRMQTFCTKELASVSKDNWGRIKVKLNGAVVDMVGKWPCSPENITIGMQFSSLVEKGTYKRKVQYSIVGEIIPVDAGMFALTNQLSKQEVPHAVLQSMVREFPDLYAHFQATTSETRRWKALDSNEASLVETAYSRIHKTVALQARFPFLTSSLCSEISDEVADIIEQAPYVLTTTNRSKEALQVADSIARKQNMKADNEDRLRAYCVHVMRDMFYKLKHYWFAPSSVLDQLQSKLHMSEWSIVAESATLQATVDKCTVRDKDLVSLKEHAKEEVELAEKINHILRTDRCKVAATSVADDVQLDEKQTEAVNTALQTSAIVCGVAGTGKTTVVRELSRIFSLENIPFWLCAPTGKAAVRMSEGLKDLGIKATTVHFAIATAPEGDMVVIIDEASMLSPTLLLRLLRKMTVVRLIIIGDPNQLASIDPGCLLKDLISSDTMRVVELQEIHRQGSGSVLAHRARDILNGAASAWDTQSGMQDTTGFSLTLSSDALPQAIEKTRQLHEEKQPVQLLVQTKKSAQSANVQLQDVFNQHAGSSLERAQKAPWKLNDLVIATENYYEDGEMLVCNGALGKIHKVDVKRKKIFASFEGANRAYSAGTSEIDHSYALTVHKYQGSEVPCVVIALDFVPNMATREALYTAVTRGKLQAHIYAPKQIWQLCLQQREGVRETRLAQRLQEGRDTKKSRFF